MPEQPPREIDEFTGLPVEDLSIIDDIVAYRNRFLNISSGEFGAGSPEEYDANQYQKVHDILGDINLKIDGVDGLDTFETWCDDPVEYKEDIEAFFNEEGTRELFSGLRDQLKTESKALASTRKQENTGNKPPPLPDKPKPQHVIDRVYETRKEKQQAQEQKATAATPAVNPAKKPESFKKFSASDMVKELQTQMKQKITEVKEAINNFRHGPGK